MSPHPILIKRKLLEGKLELALKSEERVWSFLHVFQAWQRDPAFALWWQSQLAGIAYPAIFWECPPLTKENLMRPFRCVWMRSPRLSKIAANDQAFRKYWDEDQTDRVVSFSNLGNDARLIVPMPGEQDEQYAHLLEFARKAPTAQATALWARVGKEMMGRVREEKPCWLSTAGLGVSWLHIRLDDRPKYYRHLAYRQGAQIRWRNL